MNKQTAVEWLNEAINNKLKSQLGPSFIDLFDEAKAMEKEQIEDAYEEGATDEYDPFDFNSGRKYYNSTYGL
jgi:hypothetical protein